MKASRSNLILLADGDFEAVREILRESGMAEIVSLKYYEGTFILGVSAGVLLLGMGRGNSDPLESFTETLKLFPYYVSVHNEDSDWAQI